jgi:hypothetical protein
MPDEPGLKARSVATPEERPDLQRTLNPVQDASLWTTSGLTAWRTRRIGDMACPPLLQGILLTAVANCDDTNRDGKFATSTIPVESDQRDVSAFFGHYSFEVS